MEESLLSQINKFLSILLAFSQRFCANSAITSIRISIIDLASPSDDASSNPVCDSRIQLHKIRNRLIGRAISRCSATMRLPPSDFDSSTGPFLWFKLSTSVKLSRVQRSRDASHKCSFYLVLPPLNATTGSTKIAIKRIRVISFLGIPGNLSLFTNVCDCNFK